MIRSFSSKQFNELKEIMYHSHRTLGTTSSPHFFFYLTKCSCTTFPLWINPLLHFNPITRLKYPRHSSNHSLNLVIIINQKLRILLLVSPEQSRSSSWFIRETILFMILVHGGFDINAVPRNAFLLSFRIINVLVIEIVPSRHPRYRSLKPH